MPYVTAPDIQYVMDSSFELLEQTPDVNAAAYYSGMNLIRYFDMYDAHYSMEGACSSIVNLCSMMHQWIDKQDDLTRGVILSNNIYDVKTQLNEFILGTTNTLVKNYLNNNGIQEDLSNSMYFTMNFSEERNIVNVMKEQDILFPANIATVIMQDKRSFDYLMMLKNQLVKTLDIDASFDELHKKYLKITKASIESTDYTLDERNLIVHKDSISVSKKIELRDKGRKALKKGIKKFSNLFGKNNINSFISGDGFTVEGEMFNWHFKQKKSTSLVVMTHSPLNGHIPYSLQLMNKENFVLADCCVYVSENTPIIDQIITIVMYIKHDEEELIKNCNLFNVRDILNQDVSFFSNYEMIEKLSKGADKSLKSVSNYVTEFNRISQIYNPQIKDIISNIIGIDDKFFKYMLNGYRNPVISGDRSNFYLDDFRSNKKLLKI